MYRPNWLKKRILMPVGAATATVLLLFIFGFHRILLEVANDEFVRDLEGARTYWQSDLEHHSGKLSSVLAAVAGNDRIVESLRRQDRKGLLRETADLHRALKEDHGISHLGFLNADRTVLIRIHRPEKWGDLIHCTSAIRAEETGLPQSGLALEPSSGQLVLRAVYPIERGGELIGYGVAAENIKHLLRHGDDLFRVRHAVLVGRERLGTRKSAATVTDNLGPFPQYVVLDRTISDFPSQVRALFGKGNLKPLEQGLIISGLDRDYAIGTFPLRDAADGVIGQLVLMRDVTDVRSAFNGLITAGSGLILAFGLALLAFIYRTTCQAEKALQHSYREQAASHEQLRRAHQEWVDSFDAIHEPIFLHDAEFRVIKANRAYVERAGMMLEDILGRPYWQAFPKGTGPLESCRRALGDDPGKQHEEELRLETGETLISRASFIADEQGRFRYSVHILEDISERERMTEALRRENRARKVVSESNHALIHATHEAALLDRICQIITDRGDYHFAWVGYKENTASKPIRLMACSGVDEHQLEALVTTWADNASGQNPPAVAIRAGTPQVVQDVKADPRYRQFSELAQHIGIASCMAFPLANRKEVFGTLMIGAINPLAFDKHEIDLLSELAADLAFGITALRSGADLDRAELQHDETLRKLEASLDKTVEAMATAVEMRDPYTAGHQRRVAALAVAIAEEMDLTRDQVESLKVAGMVHDLGKLYCPAEILSKPGQLSPVEFELIKNHCQVGYDILRDIDFPWPVARMVLQHHERMDGSGYPNGLKGEEILLEARILGVADVVEAMSSHRPYRPALTDNAAMQEILAYRGERYDAQVVDATVRIIRDRSFRFERP